MKRFLHIPLIRLVLLTFAFFSGSHFCSATNLERLSLMTDRACYSPGDRIWVRAFMTDAESGEPIVQSRYVYIDMLVGGNAICNQVMLKEQSGVFCGYIDIPDKTDTGRALLRAYTRANANIPSLECLTPFYIGSRTPYTYRESLSKADFSPMIQCDTVRNGLRVKISMPEECSSETVSMAIAVSTDKYGGQNGISEKIRSEVPGSLNLVDQPETSQCIRGKVVVPAGTRLCDGELEVAVLSPENGFTIVEQAEKDGSFEFSDLEIVDDSPLFIQATASDGDSDMSIEIEANELPVCRYVDYNGLVIEDEEQYLDENALLLAEAVIVSHRREKVEAKLDPFLSLATESFNAKRLAEIDPQRLDDIIMRIPGLYIDASGRIVSMRSGGRPLLVAVDGVVSYDEHQSYPDIPMSDIERIDYFRSSAALIWGTATASDGGAIAITTKSGFTGDRGLKKKSNIIKINAPGFQQYVPFSTAHSGNTVYWNPCLKTQGSAGFTMLLPLNKKDMYIHIEGISDSGKTIHLDKKL